MERRSFIGKGLAALAALAFPWKGLQAEDTSNQLVWGTADGRRLRIADMSDEHLRNAIFWMQRHAARYGSIPVYAGPGETSPTVLLMRKSEHYRAFLKEADRRKLGWTPPE
jgi:hypothetical protein